MLLMLSLMSRASLAIQSCWNVDLLLLYANDTSSIDVDSIVGTDIAAADFLPDIE